MQEEVEIMVKGSDVKTKRWHSKSGKEKTLEKFKKETAAEGGFSR